MVSQHLHVMGGGGGGPSFSGSVSSVSDMKLW